MGSKICTRCKVLKDYSEFGTRCGVKDGLRSWCKVCCKEDNKHRECFGNKTPRKLPGITSIERHKRNKVKNINRCMLKMYGMTLDDKKLMCEEQNYLCALCGKFLGSDMQRMYIDHNHLTGKVRGILHPKCNTALSYIEDRELKLNAENYLKRYE